MQMTPVDWAEIVHREPDLELAEKIRRMRLQRHWSQSDLAATAGVALGTVKRAERGKFYPSRRTLEGFAFAFSVEPAMLGVGPKAEPKPEPPDPSTQRFLDRQREGETRGRRIAEENWQVAFAEHQRRSRIEAGLGPAPGVTRIWRDEYGHIHQETGGIVFGNMGPNSFGAWLRRHRGE